MSKFSAFSLLSRRKKGSPNHRQSQKNSGTWRAWETNALISGRKMRGLSCSWYSGCFRWTHRMTDRCTFRCRRFCGRIRICFGRRGMGKERATAAAAKFDSRSSHSAGAREVPPLFCRCRVRIVILCEDCDTKGFRDKREWVSAHLYLRLIFLYFFIFFSFCLFVWFMFSGLDLIKAWKV